MQSSHSFFEPQLFLVLLLEAAVNLRKPLREPTTPFVTDFPKLAYHRLGDEAWHWCEPLRTTTTILDILASRAAAHKEKAFRQNFQISAELSNIGHPLHVFHNQKQTRNLFQSE